MTFLTGTLQAAASRKSPILFAALILLTAGFAGCLGQDDGATNNTTAPTSSGPPDGFKVHLAATGSTSSGSANVSTVGVTLEGQAQTEFLLIQTRQVDLATLASSGESELVAFSEDVSGSATRIAISFNGFSVDGTDLGTTSLSLPLNAPVNNNVNVTVSLDLAATASSGELKLNHAVAEENGNQVARLTQSDLDALNQPLPTPEILVGTGPNMTIANQTLPGANETVPTAPVNTMLNFTYELPETQTEIRNALWAFGDAQTGTGEETSHAYRTPGFYQVRLILEDTRGRQAFANMTIDISTSTAGNNNILFGSGGTGLVEDRDFKKHDFEIPGNFTSISVKLTQDGGSSGEGNVHVQLENSTQTLVGENTTTAATKYINLTGLMNGGTWNLVIRGDQGTTVSYAWDIKIHYAGLCAEAGGVAGFECLASIEAIESSSGAV